MTDRLSRARVALHRFALAMDARRRRPRLTMRDLLGSDAELVRRGQDAAWAGLVGAYALRDLSEVMLHSLVSGRQRARRLRLRSRHPTG